MAFVEKRGPNRWRARYRGLDGRERSKTFPRRVDAERWASTQEADKVRGAWVDPTLGRLTFADWSERWLSLHVDLKPKTTAGYEAILRTHLLPAFGRRSIAQIHREDVQAFVAGLVTSGAAPRTVRNVYRVLSGIMRSAVANRRIAQSPCTDAALPRPRQREMLPLSAEQVVSLAGAIDSEYAPLVYLAAYTGLRWGEVAALQVGRVRFGVLEVLESASEVGGTVQLVAPKNGRTRTVRLLGFVMEMLATLLAGRRPEELLFPGRDGGPLRHGWFYRSRFRPAVAAAGLDERIRFHDLRHTCAALLIAQGAHPRAIMERLGHSTITVTMDVYGHLLPSLDQALTDGLDATYQRARAASVRPEDGQVIALPNRQAG
jgi:integrase